MSTVNVAISVWEQRKELLLLEMSATEHSWLGIHVFEASEGGKCCFCVVQWFDKDRIQMCKMYKLLIYEFFNLFIYSFYIFRFEEGN